MQTKNLPDRDRISVLAGTILLAYLLTSFITIPALNLNLTLSGVLLPIQINFRTLVSILVAGMTAAGADWIVRDHPEFKGRLSIQHWLLPALTAWVFGSILFTIPVNLLWWLALAVGGLLLMLVLVAEYIVVDPEDARYPLASAGLSAVSFGLFLALAITLQNAGLRLFLRMPFLAAAAGLITLRILHTRLEGYWALWEMILVSLICAQVSAVFHYWPIPAATYGLLLLAPVYGIINFIANSRRVDDLRQAATEPLLVSGLLVAAAIWFMF